MPTPCHADASPCPCEAARHRVRGYSQQESLAHCEHEGLEPSRLAATVLSPAWEPSAPTPQRAPQWRVWNWSRRHGPHSPAQICTQDTESSAIRFIFLKQINFPPQHKEYSVPGYWRSRTNTQFCRFYWSHPRSPALPPRDHQRPAVFSEPVSLPQLNGCFFSVLISVTPSLCPSSSLAGDNLWEEDNTNSDRCYPLLIRI